MDSADSFAWGNGVKINANARRPRDAGLPRDKALELQHLHHLVDARCGYQKVLFNVPLGWRAAEVTDVFRDEREVFELAFSRLLGASARRKA